MPCRPGKHRMPRPKRRRVHVPAAIMEAMGRGDRAGTMSPDEVRKLREQGRAVGQESPQYQEACRIRSSGRWRKVRVLVLARTPICTVCEARPATEVHHIRSVAAAPEMAFAPENLQAMCRECHLRAEGMGEGHHEGHEGGNGWLRTGR